MTRSKASPALRRHVCCIALAALTVLTTRAPAASELADLIARVKPSVVAIGTEERTRRPPVSILGTGFAVGDGHQVAPGHG